MLDNPCKAPDCPPERAASPSGAYDTESTVWLFPRTRILAARAVFPTAVFLTAAFVFAAAFFGAAFFASFALRAFLTGFTFLPAILFVCFLLVFFLGAIGAVYHRSAIPSAWASPDKRGDRRGGHWCGGKAGPRAVGHSRGKLPEEGEEAGAGAEAVVGIAGEVAA